MICYRSVDLTGGRPVRPRTTGGPSYAGTRASGDDLNR